MQADLHLRWAHMSEGTIFDIAAQIYLATIEVLVSPCISLSDALFRIAIDTIGIFVYTP